jgi:RhtB (resistance to homoserine/threonine) family protein
MFGIINYKIFVLSAILLNLTPGADTIYILGKGVSKGRKSAIISALGISCGCLVHTLFAAFGLSVILAKSVLAFNIVKWIGALYLIYLGIKSFKSKGFEMTEINEVNQISSKKIFTEGILTNVLNPKVALFFLSFMPQFISSNNTYGTLPFLILGLTFFVSGTIWCQILAVASSLMTKKLKENQNISNIINKVTGVVFVALGLKLLKAKNN